MDARLLSAVIERDLLVYRPEFRDSLDVLAAVVHLYWHHRGFIGEYFPKLWNFGDIYTFDYCFRDNTPAVHSVIFRGKDFIETEGLKLHDDWVDPEKKTVTHMDRLVLLLFGLSGSSDSWRDQPHTQDVFFGRLVNIRVVDRAPKRG